MQQAATKTDLDNLRASLKSDMLEAINSFALRMDARFAATHDRIDAVLEIATKNRQDIGDIIGRLDSIEGQLENIQTEQAAFNHQLQRHEGWITGLAKKSNYKLRYE